MLTEPNGHAEVDALGANDLPATRLPAKGERRNRNIPRRANRSPSTALNGGALAQLGKGATVLQARLTYEITSGNPKGGSDTPPKPVEVTGAANETTGTRSPRAKVTCEVYGESGSGAETKVIFTEVLGDTDPGSGNPKGGSDGHFRSVIVELRVARHGAKQKKAQTDDNATSLSRLFTAEPSVEQLTTPT